MLKTRGKFNLKVAKKIALSILGVIIAIFFITIFYFKLSMQSNIRMELSQVKYDEPFINRNTAILKEIIIKHESKEFDVSDIKLYFGDKKLDINNMFELNQRYYILLDDFLKKMEIKYEKNDENYKVNDADLILSNNAFIKGDSVQDIRGGIIHKEDGTYISLNDLENFLGLSSVWDYKKREIKLYEKIQVQRKEDIYMKSGKGALIRLEDVSAGPKYAANESVQSMKASVDYLYENGITYHIAWIPRFKDPGNKIDNNLLTDRSMANVQFINMLDYMIYRGGIVGLHGYTHQYGSYVTAQGSDLTSKYNATEEETRNILESAIETANVLRIPYSFFESGHYHATKKQQKIIEEYFDACFEPYKYYWNVEPLISKRNNSTIYVPAPLSYVKDSDGAEMVKKIKDNKNRKRVLTALFVHPTKFMDFFDINYESGKAENVKLDNSPIENIVEALERTGHATFDINALK